MPKNIVIFSDGTGQRGGVLVDERRSNIYKLFRATRSGPDCSIDPQKQIAFYDPGIGTLPPGVGFFSGLSRAFYNLISQAFGIGLTGNIIDCYAAIIRVWRPGDRIFLFGFSRGAYTVRCLAAVISLCGIPERGSNGTPLKYDEKNSKRVAKEGVKKVYQHTASRSAQTANERQIELLNQRRELGKHFRKKYHSGTPEEANIAPHFIGVFDTVASLANPRAIAGLIVLTLLFFGVIATPVWYFFTPISFPTFLVAIVIFACTVILCGFILNLLMRFKSEIGLPRRRKWRFFHWAQMRMKFYDKQLNPKVGYARHALSIDESRPSFARVPWGDPNDWRDTGKDEAGNPNPKWFEQLWFAGNHSDIGGSYAEDESRLSDISLEWMLEAAHRVGLLYDQRFLHLFPDPAGPQHDETKSSRVFGITGRKARKIGENFPLHDSVLKRFEATDVLHYDVRQPYRPENLANHLKVKQFYS